MAKSAWDTIIQPHMDDILQWAHDGFTTREIVKKLGIGESTFFRHLKGNREFWEAYSKAQVDPNREVEAALYKIAKGCVIHKHITETKYDADGNVISKTEKDTAEEIAPNPNAAIFWLTNMVREKWQREPSPQAAEGGEGGVIVLPEVQDE